MIPAEQFRIVSQSAGYTRLDRSVIEFWGADRSSFLHNLCTNDINKLSPGTGCEAFVTDVQGKTIGHIFAFCHDDRLRVETVAGPSSFLISHFDRYLITEDVELCDSTKACRHILVTGPRCEQQLANLFEMDLPNAYDHGQASVAGSSVCVSRTPIVADPVFTLSGSAETMDQLVHLLEESRLVYFEPSVFDGMRIENRFPWFGLDITDDNLPQEVDRDETAISFHKGCYLGQETIARIDALGHVNRKLVRLRFPSDQVPERGMPITQDSKEVGKVTSAAFSHVRSCPIALAYVRCKAIGSDCQMESARGRPQLLI